MNDYQSNFSIKNFINRNSIGVYIKNYNHQIIYCESNAEIRLVNRPILWDDPSIVKSPFEKIRVFVWDFDQTVTKMPTCWLLPDEVNQIELNQVFSDPDLFVMTNYYLSQLGIKIGIASFNRKETIMTLLNRLYLQYNHQNNPFIPDKIVTPKDVQALYNIPWLECFEPPREYGVNKNTLIQILQSRLDYLVSPNQVILFDDSDRNILLAKNAGFFVKKISKNGYSRRLDSNLSPIVTEELTNQQFIQIMNNFIIESP